MNFSSFFFVSSFKLIYVQLFQIWQVSWSSTLSPSLSSPSSSSTFSKTTETSSAAANFSASQNALSPVHHEDCNFPVAEESLHKFMALFNFPTQAKRGGRELSPLNGRMDYETSLESGQNLGNCNAKVSETTENQIITINHKIMQLFSPSLQCKLVNPTLH